MPELEQLPANQQQAILEEAVRGVNSSHAQMTKTPHLVGCGLIAIEVLLQTILRLPLLLCGVAGALTYLACLFVGIVLWRRSMAKQLQKLVRDLIAGA